MSRPDKDLDRDRARAIEAGFTTSGRVCRSGPVARSEPIYIARLGSGPANSTYAVSDYFNLPAPLFFIYFLFQHFEERLLFFCWELPDLF